MKARDRRALLLLGLWAAGMGIFWATQRGIAWRHAWVLRRAELNSLCLRQGRLLSEQAAISSERETLLSGMLRIPGETGEDQLRLKGQQALLSAGERAGMKGLRLRPEAVDSQGSLQVFRWVLEGEGTLGQWVDGLQAIESSLPLMRVRTLRLDLVGDPWTPDPNAGPEGPSIRGSVSCAWMVVKS